jgi:pimeloyl-ACP methyl ester carboxylesterase
VAQLTQFVKTADDIQLAWSELGSGEPLVLERGWITHVELFWEDFTFRRFLDALARSHRVVRFDHRGMGLSDREVAVPDLDALVLDLESVIDRAGRERVVLWGSNFGGPVAVRYTARNSDRVSRLILDCSWARPEDLSASAEADRLHATMIQLMRVSPDPALAYTSYLADPAPEQRHEDRVERARKSIAPEMLAELYGRVGNMNVEADAARIDVPTLVLHRREGWVPLAAGRRLASAISGAQFVGLDGASTNLWEGDANTALRAITGFLGAPNAEVETRALHGVVVLMLTDLVASTANTVRLGDKEAQPLQRFHDATVRAALRSHDGVEFAHTGDGIFARFSSAAAALRCARKIQEEFALRNQQQTESLFVRIGLNAGEPITDEETMFGAAIPKAERVCGAANAGEILVTPVVLGLVEGKDFQFHDRGEHHLKGFDAPLRLYGLDL